MKMRRVWVTQNGTQQEEVFLGWGVDYEELRDGVGSYSVAIIEYEDGTVGTALLSCIQFVNPSNPRSTPKPLEPPNRREKV
jgi:hypothetical protein